jgi:excisionase family DNA binding protein
MDTTSNYQHFYSLTGDVQAAAMLVLAQANVSKRPDFSARFLTLEDSAAYVGVSVESIRRMVSTGKLTALRPVKGRIVLDRLQLDSVVLSSDSRPRKGRGLKS